MERYLEIKRDQLHREQGIADFHEATRIQCACRVAKNDCEMIACTICGYEQHTWCHGDVAKIPPQDHICYKCLLEDEDLDLLHGMEDLARRRRVFGFMAYGDKRIYRQSVAELFGKPERDPDA